MGHIFISYSHKDTDYAHKLADVLQREGFDVWIDARLDYGSQWPMEIQRQLDDCSAFILIMTPRAYQSEWVQSELSRAKRKIKPIFPLLLEGDEPWLSVESTQYYDVRGDKMPDSRFLGALGRVISRRLPVSQEKVITEPGDPRSEAAPESDPSKVEPKPDGEKAGTESGKTKTSPAINKQFVVALIAAVAIIIVGFIGSSIFKNWNTPSPTPTVMASAALPVIPTIFVADTATPITLPTQIYTPTVTAIPSPYPTMIADGRGVSMMLIPAGQFMMGSNIFVEEQPPHEIHLDDYYIDKYEVTNVLYRECVEAEVCEPPRQTFSNLYPDYFNSSIYDNYPVIFVDWDMANTYCTDWRLGQLPTEAQWEKAARGTDERKYPWGGDVSCSYANYWKLNDTPCAGDTTPIGSYEKGVSPYNVYDMAGNVWEWVNDSYNAQYYGNLPDGFKNPSGPVRDLNFMIIRGGGWDSGVNGVRTAYRGYQAHTYYANNLGFRCARNINP